MIEWIGIACVAWTATELLRMSTAAMQTVPASPRNPGMARSKHDTPHAAGTRQRPKRYAAWDDRGRPIDVEDLGHEAQSR